MIDLTKVFEAIISLIFAVITYFLIPYLKSKKEQADQEKSQAELDAAIKRREDLRTWVRIGVKAAEMMFNESGKGKEKYDYVFSYIKELLEAKGYTYSDQEIKMMIESEVLGLKKTASE
jgi:LL-H family phage holin